MADLHSVSAEQKRYLQIQKRNVRLIQCFRILLLILFLGLWEITARLGILDSFIYSSPSQILDTMFKMISDGSLAKHVSVTLTEIPAIIIVFILLPSHTISRGARADFGKLFNTTK